MVSDKAAVLAEALPYIQKYAGRIVVIKYGGNAMINNELKAKVIQDVILLKALGIKPVVVHGGGPEITALLKKLGKQSEFVAGLRVTDAETMVAAEMVLVGKTNTEIVSLLNRHGAKAVGLNGKDANLIVAAKHLAKVHAGDEVKYVDVGFVGDVVKINPDIVFTLLAQGYIPVIAPIGAGEDGESYNINADYAAGEIAGALSAAELLLLTDVEGIYRDYHDKSTFISSLTFTQAADMIKAGSIDGGMIPKVEACMKALAGGAGKARIIDGRLPHSLLMATLEGQAIGTELVNA